MIARPLRAVTFDVTGTLIHAPRLGEIYAEVLGRHGLEVEPTAVRRTVRQVWQEFGCATRLGEDRFSTHPEGCRGWWGRFLDRVCEHLRVGPPSAFAKAELFDRFGHAEAWEVYGDVADTLDRLRAGGLKLGVISNWDHRLPRLLDLLGLGPRFEAVVYSQEVGGEKPFPFIFRRALECLGEPAERVLHVGDRPDHDVEGARAVGIRALHLDRYDGEGDLSDLRSLVKLCAPPTGQRQEVGETRGEEPAPEAGPA